MFIIEFREQVCGFEDRSGNIHNLFKYSFVANLNHKEDLKVLKA